MSSGWCDWLYRLAAGEEGAAASRGSLVDGGHSGLSRVRGFEERHSVLL